MSDQTKAIPGQLLGSISTYQSGEGTHVYEKNIYASIRGLISIIDDHVDDSSLKGQQKKKKQQKSTISIFNTKSIPKLNSIVLCRVTRVQQRQVQTSILISDYHKSMSKKTSTTKSTIPMTYNSNTNEDLQYQAILRKEDVRMYEKDKIELNDCFRVGDIIIAKVISLGNEKNYYISTTGDEFGVIVAWSSDGNRIPLIPISWKEMRDDITSKIELRKVAKPS